MNTPFQFDQQQQKDRALLDDFQRELITKMRERLKEPDLDNVDLCKLADKCANFQKIALSRDRLVAYERRTDAMYHIAQGRKDTLLEIARIRAEASRRRPDHPQVDEDDDLAPWGRKKDGTPYTHEEFKTSLNEAIRDIWGLPPVNPNSYMPWEMKRAKDGTLVAPDDPSVASDATAAAGSCTSCDAPAPPLPLRERAGVRVDSPGAPVTDDSDTPRTASAARDPFVSSLLAAAGNSKFAITTGSSSSRRETSPARYPSEDG